jgi:hypothetical protein
MPSSGHRSATGVGSGVGEGVGRSVGLAVGEGEAVGDGLAVWLGAGGGGVAATNAMTPPTTIAATPAAAATWPRRERMNLVNGDALGVGPMRRILVGVGPVTMGRSA